MADINVSIHVNGQSLHTDVPPTKEHPPSEESKLNVTPPSDSAKTLHLNGGLRLAIRGIPIVSGVLSAWIEGSSEHTSVSYAWVIDGTTISTSPYLRIESQHFKKTVQCEVRADGEAVTSPPITITDQFQGITLEEHENSYPNQFGRTCTTDKSCAAPAITTTTNSCLIELQARKPIYAKLSTSANLPEHFSPFMKHNPCDGAFTSQSSFAILTSTQDTNRLLVWGSDIPKETAYPLSGIRSVYSNDRAFAFIYQDPIATGFSIGAIGDKTCGGTVPDAIQLAVALDPPSAIYATAQAFAVVTQKGKVYSWGSANHGGTIDANTQALLARFVVYKLFSTGSAFCALSASGEIVTWGSISGGANLPSAVLNDILEDGGASTVIANESAFCVISQRSRKAFAWGNSMQGGTMNADAQSLASRGNIVLCKASRYAFCIINHDGLAQAWGDASQGGKIDNNVNSTINSIIADDDEPKAQGDLPSQIKSMFSDLSAPRESETNPLKSNTYYPTYDGSISIYSTSNSFCLLSQAANGRTRNIVSWGPTAATLDFSKKQILLASCIEYLACSNGAFAAITRQGGVSGCLITWGAVTADGGAIPKELAKALEQGVTDVQPINSVITGTQQSSSFVARTHDGRYVSWGGVLPSGVLADED